MQQLMERTASAAESAPLASSLDLVQAAAGGDVAAFERLVVARTERAYRIARSMLGNDADAHDVTQESMLAAWRQLPKLRDRSRVREISLETDAAEHPLDGPGFDERIGDADRLGRAFDRLDADKRAILVLHYHANESVAAIAAALGIAAGTVKWRLSEARSALARALVAEGEAHR